MKLRLRVKRLLLITTVSFLVSYQASAQKVFLVCHKKKIPFPNPMMSPWIGLTTATDTIRYFDKKEVSYSLYNTGTESLTIRRPVKYHDTTMPADDYYNNRPSFEIIGTKEYRQNGKRYITITRADTDEYRSFAYKDITSLRYPTYTGNGDGCVGCFFIPGLNVYYFIWATNRWKPHTLDMKEWTFVVK